MRKLHIMEDPRLHGKPADAPFVHVVWESTEYAYWSIGERGELLVWRWTGHYPNAIATQTAAPCYVVEPGMHFKVWDEEEVSTEPTSTADPVNVDVSVDELIQADFAIERAQPGHDGFSEDPQIITGEVAIVSADEGYVEPDDQKTQVIDDPMVTNRHIIDIASTTELVIPSVNLRTDAKPLDWGTLKQPLVVPENISFFEEDWIEKE